MRRHSDFISLAINPVPIRGRKKSSLLVGDGIYAAGYRDFGISYLAPHTEAVWIP
jgi:hypothetical protein